MSEIGFEIYINGKRFPRPTRLSARMMIDLLLKHADNGRPWKSRMVIFEGSGIEGKPGDAIAWYKFHLNRC